MTDSALPPDLTEDEMAKLNNIPERFKVCNEWLLEKSSAARRMVETSTIAASCSRRSKVGLRSLSDSDCRGAIPFRQIVSKELVKHRRTRQQKQSRGSVQCR
jgi:hypothetical protein